MLDERTLDVNEYGVLRIPAALWLGLMIQCRYSIFGLFLLFAGQQGQAIWQLLDAKMIAWLLLMEVPALLAMFVCATRRPEAGRMVRILWGQLVPLVVVSAIAHIGYTGWYLWHSSYWLPWPELAIASAAVLDVLICIGLFRDTHLRAVLAEFPAPQSVSSSE